MPVQFARQQHLSSSLHHVRGHDALALHPRPWHLQSALSASHPLPLRLWRVHRSLIQMLIQKHEDLGPLRMHSRILTTLCGASVACQPHSVSRLQLGCHETSLGFWQAASSAQLCAARCLEATCYPSLKSLDMSGRWEHTLHRHMSLSESELLGWPLSAQRRWRQTELKHACDNSSQALSWRTAIVAHQHVDYYASTCSMYTRQLPVCPPLSQHVSYYGYALCPGHSSRIRHLLCCHAGYHGDISQLCPCNLCLSHAGSKSGTLSGKPQHVPCTLCGPSQRPHPAPLELACWLP